MGEMTWPSELAPVPGPMAAAKLVGVRDGMGAAAPTTVALIDRGLLSADSVCGLTLYLLSRQPRTARMDREGRTSGTDGGVWVRERFTCHRPIRADERFLVTGASTGRYVRRGRRYGTTVSETRSASGELLAANMTTGLLAYRVEAGLEDEVVGSPLDETLSPQPAFSQAAENPCRPQLSSAEVGQRLGGEPVLMSLAMMAARDTDNPDNPIHSDPEKARAAGLDRPIAGGSHVLAFALEPILAAWGDEVLFHGSCLDVRWKAPTRSDVELVATATVSDVRADRVCLDLHVGLADDVTAMTGTVVIPR